MKNKVNKNNGPSEFLLAALIMSILLLVVVLVWRHKVLDSIDDVNSTSKISQIRDLKNDVKQEVKNKLIEKLQKTD